MSSVVGYAGVKYGLIHPNKEKKPTIKKNSLFSADDDSDDVNTTIQKQNSATDKKAKKLLDEALAQDPYALSYDEIIPEMKKERDRRAPEKEVEKKPRYFHQLMKSAQEREREDNVLYQRKILRELEEERKLFGDETTKYITPSYRKQIEENKKFLEEQKLKDELDEKRSAKAQGMGAFFLNVLDQKNVAYGGEDETNKILLNRDKKRERDSDDSEDDEDDEEKRKRKRQRVMRDQAEAERLRKEREEARQKKMDELQQQYSQRRNDDEAVKSAKERYLERKRMREEEAKSNKN
eukprot:TRINITY_DN1493_c1_g2_i1.p1 TRINITY_DN1493_c1_g2~~TRINITY_DN1493_c1_g2_i1.p1  ORF type:complete len:294 (+),score=103.17 TRINITY_DN1493_c1_g2_i1:16-897(+)